MKHLLWLPMLVSLCSLTFARQAPAVHDRAFWRAIVEADFQPPEGADAYGLLLELDALLDSPDEELRDSFGYGIPEAWIYRQKRFSEQQLKAQVAALSARLKRGLGQRGAPSVLGRSFAALNLSVLVARDLKQPFLGEEEFDQLLDDSLHYLERERDLRGWEPGLGWLHSCAHGADLLKFIARHPRLDTKAERARVLQGLAKKTVAPSGVVFVHGEEERMAQAVLAILQRPDFELETFDTFRRTLQDARRIAPPGEGFSPEAAAAGRNAKNLLRVLLQWLRAGRLEDFDRSLALEERILGSLATLN